MPEIGDTARLKSLIYCSISRQEFNLSLPFDLNLQRSVVNSHLLSVDLVSVLEGFSLILLTFRQLSLSRSSSNSNADWSAPECLPFKRGVRLRCMSVLEMCIFLSLSALREMFILERCLTWRGVCLRRTHAQLS